MYIDNLKRKQVDELMAKIVQANSEEKITNSLIIRLSRDKGYGKVMIQIEHSKGRRLEFYDMDDYTMCKDKVKVENLTKIYRDYLAEVYGTIYIEDAAKYDENLGFAKKDSNENMI